MQTRPISRAMLMLGAIVLIVTVLSVIGKALTDSMLFIFVAIVLAMVFAFGHGVLRYGWRAMAVLVAMVIVVSWSYETLSILTGFPFGHYHYTDLLGPRIWLVPAMIIPSYFAVGYLSWTIASILIGKRDNSVSTSELWLLPTLSSFVMVMWDVSLDPLSATIAGEWIWENGGPYFGIPLVNYLGWFLCVFTFYFAFALYLRKARIDTDITVITRRGYWVLPLLAYGSATIEYWGDFLLRESTAITDKAGHVWYTGDIYGSVVLTSTFTMIFVCFLGLLLIGRDSTLEAAG